MTCIRIASCQLAIVRSIVDHWLARTINVIHFHSIGFQINSKQTLNRCGKSLSQIASVPIEEPLRYIGWEALDEEAPIGGR